MKSKINMRELAFYSSVFLGFIVLVAGMYEALLRIPTEHKPHILNTKSFAATHFRPLNFASPTPTKAPTPTVTPTPAEPSYTGFCLNTPVLMYHHTMPWGIAKEKGQTSLDVDSNIFDQQMGYLVTHGYTFYFASDLLNALVTHTPLSGKSIVITLDDGYDDVYNYAFPVFKKYNIKATVMVPTGLLGNTSNSNSYYNWGQLKDMVNSGLVSVGNHTWSHYPVGSGTQEKDQYEIMTAEKEIQQNLGITTNVFTYPYGTNALLQREHTLLQQDGFAGAFSTIGGTLQCDSFIYALHRTRVGSIPFPAFGIY